MPDKQYRTYLLIRFFVPFTVVPRIHLTLSRFFGILSNIIQFYGPLAQLAEHRPFKAVVGGSNPARLNL